MEFLKIQKFCLYTNGFSFKSNESRLLRMYSLLNLTALIVIVLPECQFVIENKSNIPLATDTLCALLTVILSISKLSTMYFKKEKVYHLIQRLDDLWLTSTKSDRLILEKGHKRDKRLTLTYLISTVMAVILYSSYPIVKGIHELLTTGSAEWIMPVRSIFPYDISVSPNYELTYLWFLQCTYSAAIGSVGVDCLFYGSSCNISSHFQIIQKKIRDAKFEETVLQPGTRAAKRVVSKKLHDIIRYHQVVFDICKEFENVYAEVMFIQFLITSIQLCVIGFQITLPNLQFIMIATKSVLLAAIFLQLFTYCHAGSQLTTESSAVADAIYDTNWYETTPATRKFSLFFLMRSQKSVVFMQFSGFYIANMETFKMILSAAASYIAILQTLSEK